MFLKNKNIIFKIRRSKVTDYAALKRIITKCMFLSSTKICEASKTNSADTDQTLCLCRIDIFRCSYFAGGLRTKYCVLRLY